MLNRPIASFQWRCGAIKTPMEIGIAEITAKPSTPRAMISASFPNPATTDAKTPNGDSATTISPRNRYIAIPSESTHRAIVSASRNVAAIDYTKRD